MADEKAAGEDIGVRRRRLRYRAWHRGMREMDLVLGPYCDARLGRLGAGELDRLEALMEEADSDLMAWVLGRDAPPAHIDRAMLDAIKSFAGGENR